MRATSIHLRPVEVRDEQGFFYLHDTRDAGKSWGGAGVEMVSGCNLRGVCQNNIHSK